MEYQPSPRRFSFNRMASRSAYRALLRIPQCSAEYARRKGTIHRGRRAASSDRLPHSAIKIHLDNIYDGVDARVAKYPQNAAHCLPQTHHIEAAQFINSAACSRMDKLLISPGDITHVRPITLNYDSVYSENRNMPINIHAASSFIARRC
ncbi:hypothetical protein [Burkholderia vietnamiensis]|uniref:hypothetical protein n=1 Tax=Burkholderia vietnamiensis TaxID=60552 RepID=UPI001BA2EF04|nr:hypothetical protein [Burkholderia vietnamiensis]MBR7998514.1 hypothetical protein [Burkholderia vietnamiensis]